MISQIQGTVVTVETGAAVIDVGGIGFRVYATPDALSHCARGAKMLFYTHLAVRENAIDLYGFLSDDERRFFGLLLEVPGIGPKSALAVLSLATVETLRDAAAAGDINYLTKVSGIGRKTAEKIVVTLKDKLGASHGHEARAGEGDVLDALRSLGYSAEEAREALKSIPRDIAGTSDRVKEALKLLGSRAK